MNRKLRFKPPADERLTYLEVSPTHKGILKQVRKILGYLETNLEASSLQIHPHHSLSSRYRIPIFESYAQHDTPGAYRIFWHYGPDEKNGKGKHAPVITIVDITPRP